MTVVDEDLKVNEKQLLRPGPRYLWLADLPLSQQSQPRDSTPRRRIAWIQTIALLDESMTQGLA